MPFIHNGCGGKVSIITGKCSKCHKKFKPNSANPNGLPNNVYFDGGERIKKMKAKAASKVASRGTTPYAKWADKAPVPGLASIASSLPNWPRWARILTTVGIAVALIFVIRGCI